MFVKKINYEILLIHMGGLGDVCLSESLFLSLTQHFKEPLVACGIRRYFDLFPDYFLRIENIESAKWLFLFSQYPSDMKWERIVFVGKDSEGSLRKRINRYSEKQLIFIEMYPKYGLTWEGKHVEDYQLTQLEKYGIKPVKKDIEPIWRDRVILYPEKGFSKKKWGIENFLELYRRLKFNFKNVYIMEPFEVKSKIEDSIVIKDLNEVKKFFSKGGVFVSNDSGMAHLAGACGMLTVTIFTDFDPLVWHPRGKNISLKNKNLDLETVLSAIYSFMNN